MTTTDSSNLYVGERSSPNEERIKDHIVKMSEHGVCDLDGRTIPRGHRHPHKTSRYRLRYSNKELFNANYDKIDWEEK